MDLFTANRKLFCWIWIMNMGASSTEPWVSGEWFFGSGHIKCSVMRKAEFGLHLMMKSGLEFGFAM
jgi:hypothetical protein